MPTSASLLHLPVARRGQSLIAYRHADRTAAVEQQARRRLADFARDVPITPITAIRALRGTTRLFLVSAATTSHSKRASALAG